MADIAIAIQNSHEPVGAMESRPLPMAVGNEGQQTDHGIWCREILDKIIGPPQPDAVQSTTSYYLRRYDPIVNPDCPSIFKFPDQTEATTVAAIGPYHRSVQAEQQIITNAKKRNIVKFLIDRQDLDIDQFLRWVLKEEKRARKCYERGSLGHIQKSKDFAEMLLLDGCLLLFAIFLLRPSAFIDRRPADMAATADKTFRDEFLDISADISFNRKQLKLELLMLDNQIPFFVVEMLYRRTSLFDGIVPGRIEEIALSCFEDIHPRCNYDIKHPSFPETVHHLLHLFHWSRSPSGKYKVVPPDFVANEPKSQLPSATELRESATVFKKQPSGSLLDLSFHRSMFRTHGKMSIPALYLYDQSELIFRSLIAFEQSHLRCGISVTAFCICMARLLQSETDAKLLRKNRILAHTDKTDQEIVDFFKKLSGEYKETAMPMDLRKLYEDVATHHESPLGRFIGAIILQYFPTPLIAISVTVGAIIVLFTLAYKIHSWSRYYHPRH